MEKQTRNIINFYELSEKWQAEAIRNLDDLAKETSYLEPPDSYNPKEHVLWDLSECFPVKNEEYNATITISNNSAMLLNIDDTFETAEVWYV